MFCVNSREESSFDAKTRWFDAVLITSTSSRILSVHHHLKFLEKFYLIIIIVERVICPVIGKASRNEDLLESGGILAEMFVFS
jgi:hypothetical protein